MDRQGYFAYEKKADGICILRCYGSSGSVTVPEELDGLAVTEVSPYAFAAETQEEPVNTGGFPCICGEGLEELYLPRTVRRLGRYIFYNCRNLRSLSFYSNIAYMGAGAFTGCGSLSDLKMYQTEGRSCLREILQDLKQKVAVECYREGQESGEGAGRIADAPETAERKPFCRLVFPEFFEEAVENTPARIISTQTHGMGIQYRNAFCDTQVMFGEYDRLFTVGKYNIDSTTAAEMSVSRLRYPFSLEGKAEGEYAKWLAGHLRESLSVLLGQEDMESLRWLAETFVSSAGQMELLLEEAKGCGNLQAVSMLMDVKHRRFPAKEKQFCL